jgi:AcrR family transcriptional regulator
LTRGRNPKKTNRRLTAEARREVIEAAATEVFAEMGYRGASMDEIARRSGVAVPVLYDHFASKQDLHRRLLERHFAELRSLWREQLGGGGAPAERMARAVDAWFAYVQAHPYAWRMLFRDDATPEAATIRREVAAQSRAAALPLLARERGAENIAGASDEELDLAWEVVRAVLQGLALWWYDHQQVPRSQIVATAMNSLWIGLERAMRGETWQPDHTDRHDL